MQKVAGGVQESLENAIEGGAGLFSEIQTAIQKKGRFAMLAGAGISVSARVPGAGKVVEELKSHFPDRLDPNKEYGYAEAFELALPGTENRGKRRQFIEQLFAGKKPTDEHHLILRLLGNRSLSVVLTTNFDHLLEAASYSSNMTPLSVYAHDVDPEPLEFAIANPRLVKLHGDFLYDDLANLDVEMKARLTDNMRYRIVNHLRNKGLIVVGYAGKDNSVMGILQEAARNPQVLDGGVFWAIHRESERDNPLLVSLSDAMARSGKPFRLIGPTDATPLLKQLCIGAGTSGEAPVHFGFSRDGPEGTFGSLPHLVRAPIQFPPPSRWEEKHERDKNAVGRLAEQMSSKRVILINGPPSSGKSSLVSELVSTIGHERALYFDVQYSSNPPQDDLSEQLTRYSETLGVPASECNSYGDILTRLFGKNVVVLIDGLGTRIGLRSFLPTIAELVYSCSIAGRGNVVLVIPDFLESYHEFERNPRGYGKSGTLREALLLTILHAGLKASQSNTKENQSGRIDWDSPIFNPWNSAVKTFSGTHYYMEEHLVLGDNSPGTPTGQLPDRFREKGFKEYEAFRMTSVWPQDYSMTAADVGAFELTTTSDNAAAALPPGMEIDEVGSVLALSNLRFGETLPTLESMDVGVTRSLVDDLAKLGLVEVRSNRYLYRSFDAKYRSSSAAQFDPEIYSHNHSTASSALLDGRAKLDDRDVLLRLAKGYHGLARRSDGERTRHFESEAIFFYDLAGKYFDCLRDLIGLWSRTGRGTGFQGHFLSYALLAIDGSNKVKLSSLTPVELVLFNLGAVSNLARASDPSQLDMDTVHYGRLLLRATQLEFENRYPEEAEALTLICAASGAMLLYEAPQYSTHLYGRNISLTPGEPLRYDEPLKPLEMFTNALRRIKGGKFLEVVAMASMSVAQLSSKPEDRIEWAKKAANKYLKLHDETGWADAQTSLAQGMIMSSDFEGAIGVQKSALEIYSQQSGFSSGKSEAYRNIFLCNLYLGNLDLAEGYFYESNLDALYSNQPIVLANLLSLLTYSIAIRQAKEKLGSVRLEPNLPSPSTVYRASMREIPRISIDHPGQIYYLITETLQARFYDCLARRDREGCVEVMQDLNSFGRRQILIPIDAEEGNRMFSEAFSKVFSKQDDEKIAKYDEAIHANPSDPNLHYDKGNVLHDLGRDEEALVEFDSAISLNPQSPRYHNVKATSLSALGRDDEAIAEYDKAIQLDPKESIYHGNKGLHLSKQRKFEEAIEEYDRAIVLDNKIPNWPHSKGIALEELERDEEAITALDGALKLNPVDAYAHFYKGNALVHIKRYAEAVTEYDEAIRLKSDDNAFHNNRAYALQELAKKNRGEERRARSTRSDKRKNNRARSN
jgi:tetratricopeptide (TPR) repeat protein